METMKWAEFKNILSGNPELHLQFQYADSKWVDESYHITEIKQAPITSVDCGSVVNNWTEVIVQLWEPATRDGHRAMTVGKALSIVQLVEKAMPLDAEAVVKIEFGNTAFDTRQMLPNAISIEGDNLLVDLRADAVQCKAIGRGGSCGTTDAGEECCAPAEKPRVQLKNLATETTACAPGSGCC